ncbi:MAG: MoaD/ThiS family protein [Chloroflexota bacterium]|nr:MoaD/ThiS family protein [Chloroflexota bacterium]
MAKIRYREKEWEVEDGITVRDAIMEIGMKPHSVLALRDKRLIKGQTVVEPGDEIILVNIISGG